ncbi:hypothetical protein C8R44DRAFT_881365 [Mycena epipterygia]|nr:hypothetical protein C8R44DRAFT_881365 [Mycena epipterygia]
MVLDANTEMGLEAAKHFATMTPERLILACRSESRGQATMERIEGRQWIHEGRVTSNEVFSSL